MSKTIIALIQEGKVSPYSIVTYTKVDRLARQIPEFFFYKKLFRLCVLIGRYCQTTRCGGHRILVPASYYHHNHPKMGRKTDIMIEKNIPIPPRGHGTIPKGGSPTKLPNFLRLRILIAEMHGGDSLWLNKKQAARFVSLARKMDTKTTIRTLTKFTSRVWIAKERT